MANGELWTASPFSFHIWLCSIFFREASSSPKRGREVLDSLFGLRSYIVESPRDARPSLAPSGKSHGVAGSGALCLGLPRCSLIAVVETISFANEATLVCLSGPWRNASRIELWFGPQKLSTPAKRTRRKFGELSLHGLRLPYTLPIAPAYRPIDAGRLSCVSHPSLHGP